MLKCWLGLHDWRYFAMAPEYQQAFPEHGHVGRDCCHCGRLEYANSGGKEWSKGVKGRLITVEVVCKNA